VIDHSVQVDFSSTKDAFEKNMQMEFKRNNSRYQFLKWGTQAFDGFCVIPPGIGICHQVNLEYLAKAFGKRMESIFPILWLVPIRIRRCNSTPLISASYANRYQPEYRENRFHPFPKRFWQGIRDSPDDKCQCRRDHTETVKRLCAPLQELVTRVVAFEFHLHILFKRIFGTGEVYLHRMIDH